MKYRFVKCNNQHGPGNCNFSQGNKINKNQIYCVNCKNDGHPASYRECPILIELKKKAKETFNSRKERKKV